MKSNYHYYMKRNKVSFANREFDDDDINVMTDVIRNSKVIRDFCLSHIQNSVLTDGRILNAIGNNHTLVQIWLCDVHIGVEGAKMLAAALKINRSIIRLCLGSNWIGDEGATHLCCALGRDSTVLRELSLTNNKIGDRGAESLAASLKENQYLRSIYLGWNNIGDSGAMSLASSFETNTSLRYVSLRENNVGNNGCNRLASVLGFHHRICYVDLSGNNLISKPVRRKITNILRDQTRRDKTGRSGDYARPIPEEKLMRATKPPNHERKSAPSSTSQHEAMLGKELDSGRTKENANKQSSSNPLGGMNLAQTETKDKFWHDTDAQKLLQSLVRLRMGHRLVHPDDIIDDLNEAEYYQMTMKKLREVLRKFCDKNLVSKDKKGLFKVHPSNRLTPYMNPNVVEMPDLFDGDEQSFEAGNNGRSCSASGDTTQGEPSNKRNVDDKEPITAAGHRQKRSKLVDISKTSPNRLEPGAKSRVEETEDKDETAGENTGTSNQLSFATKEKVQCVKKEETDDEDFSVGTTGYGNFATCKDIFLLYKSIKGKSRTAKEQVFFSHLRNFITDKQGYLLLSDFNKIKGLVAEFEYLSQSANDEDSIILESLLERLIKQCKEELKVAV